MWGGVTFDGLGAEYNTTTELTSNDEHPGQLCINELRPNFPTKEQTFKKIPSFMCCQLLWVPIAKLYNEPFNTN